MKRGELTASLDSFNESPLLGLMLSFLGTFLIYALTSSAQGLCSEIFVAPQKLALVPSLIQKKEWLIPHVDTTNKSLIEIYFVVLETYERTALQKDELPELLRTHLSNSFSSRYELPTRSTDIKTFYLNALHGYYGRIAWEWKKQTVESLTGTALGGRELIVAQALMDTFFGLGGMGSDSVKSHSIRETLERKEWESYPWISAFEIFRAWEKSEAAKAGFSGFYRWLDGQPQLPKLSFAELERLFLAITKTAKTYSYAHCCKSSFACMSCPHNRKWLKESTN